MASTNDQLHMRLINYPGGFSPTDPSKYVLPEVHYYNKSGALTRCAIEVQGCYGGSLNVKLGDPPLPMPINATFFERNPHQEFHCRVYTITTVVNPALKPPLFVWTGKNLARSNATTIFRQALIHAFTRYKSYALSNRRISVSSPHLTDTKDNSVRTEANKRISLIPPMLACSDDVKEWLQRVGPAHTMIQYKYDGVRAIAHGKGSNFIVYSRDLRGFPPHTFATELEILCDLYPHLYFDGEVYKHGVPLQIISGSVRTTGKHKSPTVLCEFMLFDCFQIDEAGAVVAEPYVTRYQRLVEIWKAVQQRFNVIKLVTGIIPTSGTDIQRVFAEAVQSGYEGLVLKDLTRPYDPSYNGYHSDALCKYKTHFRAEFMVVGWNEGEGKWAGKLGTWTVQICSYSKTGDAKLDLPLRAAIGRQFRCNPKVPDELRTEWFKTFSAAPFADFPEYKKPATVEFFTLSEDGIPTQPFWIAFRDDLDLVDQNLEPGEVDELINDLQGA